MTHMRSPNFADVSRLLAPRSIAVIGASDQPGNLGGVAIRLSQKFGYPGSLWPINPRRAEVHGIACHARVADLPAPAELALFATAAESLPSLVRECAGAGIRCGIAWAGGFAEVGERGIALQRELVDACRDTGFALAGPNCIGIIDSWMPVTASFASFLTEVDELVRGDISMLSQSGGTATMAQAFAQQAGFGFRYMISTGNEAVLTASDYLHALVEDRHTRVIAAYLEGVGDGERFLAALDEARAAGKPVVVLKGGETAASARAAVAHTGALAGERRVWDAVFRDAGVVQVHSLEELLDTVLFLTSIEAGRVPSGNGVAAVTFGGGGGVLAADQAARCDLALPTLADATQRALRPLVPPIAAITNPVDLTPQAFNQAEWFARFPGALDAIAADPAIHSILLQFGPMAQRGMEIARAICDFRHRTAKTVCFAWPLAPRGVAEFLREQGAYVFTEHARAIKVLGRLARWQAVVGSEIESASMAMTFDWSAHLANPTAGYVMSEPDCHRLLEAAGLPVAAGRLVRSADEAAEAAAAVGMPVALKGISAKVTHRAAAGLVALGIDSGSDARESYRVLDERAARAGVALDGVYVQRMVSGGLEVLVSAFRDPVFGPMISCGAGGNLTELIDDVTLQRAPVSQSQAERMIDRLRIARVANGMRPQPDRRVLAAFVARLSQLAAGAPWRRFVLEINPVKWDAGEVTAVDGLLIVEET
ncbi:MAG: acetate--CoA ligase family protein [Betaproteobacteria bacterium]